MDLAALAVDDEARLNAACCSVPAMSIHSIRQTTVYCMGAAFTSSAIADHADALEPAAATIVAHMLSVSLTCSFCCEQNLGLIPATPASCCAITLLQALKSLT